MGSGKDYTRIFARAGFIAGSLRIRAGLEYVHSDMYENKGVPVAHLETAGVSGES